MRVDRTGRNGLLEWELEIGRARGYEGVEARAEKDWPHPGITSVTRDPLPGVRRGRVSVARVRREEDRVTVGNQPVTRAQERRDGDPGKAVVPGTNVAVCEVEQVEDVRLLHVGQDRDKRPEPE